MLLKELELDLPVVLDRPNLLAQIRDTLRFRLPQNTVPLRFSITESRAPIVKCAISCLEMLSSATTHTSIFEFTPSKFEHASQFNVVFLVPAGIGAEIGGHAGDATPAARLISEVCDTLILHPNVVNASDINEMPANSLYVEGSIIARLLMGTIGIIPTRSNRILVLIDEHEDKQFINASVNAVSAARASYGLMCSEVIKLSPPVMMAAEFTEYGTAAGRINGLERVFAVLEEEKGKFDAVAISSVIAINKEFHQKYFDAAGQMVNPWGGVEAMLTHAISCRFNIPSAHSPMFESQEISTQDPGIVEPRMAAEAISLTFFESVLKGLHKSPRVIVDSDKFTDPRVITASDISCLVIPDGCIGLPTLAALEQGIQVIAVKENKNLMQNDLTVLPWGPGQLHIVENYWEAVGVLCAIRSGISPESVRRPISYTHVRKREFNELKDGQVSSELTDDSTSGLVS